MHAVLEEVENNMACLVPDSAHSPIYLPITALPSDYEIGDVFVLKVRDDCEFVLEKDSTEKEKRLSSNEAKRQRLIERTKKS